VTSVRCSSAVKNLHCRGINGHVKVYALKKGDKIGLRGPFGNGFDAKGVKRALLVGGGVGAVPLLPLLEKMKNKKVKSEFLLAARSKGRLLFVNELKKVADELYITTDDGSFGFKGFTTAVLENELKNKKIDFIYACGPEVMMKKVMELGLKHSIQGELSLERFMACGYGICAQCMVDDRLVCKDGPVFSFKEAKNMKEFGAFAYTPSGRKATLKEYYSH